MYASIDTNVQMDAGVRNSLLEVACQIVVYLAVAALPHYYYYYYYDYSTIDDDDDNDHYYYYLGQKGSRERSSSPKHLSVCEPPKSQFYKHDASDGLQHLTSLLALLTSERNVTLRGRSLCTFSGCPGCLLDSFHAHIALREVLYCTDDGLFY